MTYEECMSQLKEQDLYEEFCSVFEKEFTEPFLKKLRLTNKINSVASLIRMSITYIEKDTDIWNEWVELLQWYMKPEFERINITNPRKLKTK